MFFPPATPAPDKRGATGIASGQVGRLLEGSTRAGAAIPLSITSEAVAVARERPEWQSLVPPDYVFTDSLLMHVDIANVKTVNRVGFGSSVQLARLSEQNGNSD